MISNKISVGYHIYFYEETIGNQKARWAQVIFDEHCWDVPVVQKHKLQQKCAQNHVRNHFKCCVGNKIE